MEHLPAGETEVREIQAGEAGCRYQHKVWSFAETADGFPDHQEEHEDGEVWDGDEDEPPHRTLQHPQPYNHIVDRNNGFPARIARLFKNFPQSEEGSYQIYYGEHHAPFNQHFLYGKQIEKVVNSRQEIEDLPIFKDITGRRLMLPRAEQLNPDKIVTLLNIRAKVSIIDMYNS